MIYRINYEFYDIYAMLVNFRAFPEHLSHYLPAVRLLAETMAPGTPEPEEESVRQLLRRCYLPDDTGLDWVLVDNRYTAHIRIIKDEARYAVLAALLRELMECEGDPARVNLLCDAAHNIPLLLADETKPRKHIKPMLSDYRKMYCRDFLAEALRTIR